MKITNVRAHVLRSALQQPFAFSQGWVSSRGATLVEVETDEGVRGWGEALCQGLQPPEIAAAAIEKVLKDLIVGADPLQPEVLWHRMYHHTRDYGQKGAVIGAISGIDIALWDIAGKVRREVWRSFSAACSVLACRPTPRVFTASRAKAKLRASRRKPGATWRTASGH